MQNFQNHRRVDWVWFTAFFALVIITIAFLRDIVRQFSYSSKNGFHSIIVHWLTMLGFIVSRVVLLKLRSYATKLQDRIIRQEVQFRYFVMTGKMLDNRITMKQMIALRFAGDNQFVHLCQQSAKLGLSQKAIKELITDWKADTVGV